MQNYMAMHGHFQPNGETFIVIPTTGGLLSHESKAESSSVQFSQQIHTYRLHQACLKLAQNEGTQGTAPLLIFNILSPAFWRWKKNMSHLPNCTLRHQTFSLPLPHWKAAREAADLIRGANPDPHRWSMLQWHVSKWKPWWLLTDIVIALLTHW